MPYFFNSAVDTTWTHQDLNGRNASNGRFERRCHHCGEWFFSHGNMWRSDEQMNTWAQISYCGPCLTEYYWRESQYAPAPYKRPIERPKVTK